VAFRGFSANPHDKTIKQIVSPSSAIPIVASPSGGLPLKNRGLEKKGPRYRRVRENQIDIDWCVAGL
jgi:hypothetical protein